MSYVRYHTEQEPGTIPGTIERQSCLNRAFLGHREPPIFHFRSQQASKILATPAVKGNCGSDMGVVFGGQFVNGFQPSTEAPLFHYNTEAHNPNLWSICNPSNETLP